MKDLTRQFRPGKWDEIIGQDHVVKTLINEIKNNCVGHAYLFEGPRGTGKTTTGRVFANALEAQVIEMDAASNGGIDHIRNLRDDVLFQPTNGAKYKVYIIDEIHMMTTAAFNAFLKTLEEPPAHVIFILATTDPQKIPITVLSRCQRFSLKRITVTDIVERLKFICKAEKIKLDPGNEGEILDYIAKQVDGGMRDAIKLLQKCTSIDDVITVGTVVDSLGSVNSEFIETMIKHVLNSDIKNTISYFNNLVMEGIDIKIFLSDMIDTLKSGMAEDVSNSNFDIESRMKLTEELLDLIYTLRNATQVKTIAELRLMRVCNMNRSVTNAEIKTAAPEEKQEKVYQVPLREDPNKDLDKALAELSAIVQRYGVRFEALEMGMDALKFKR